MAYQLKITKQTILIPSINMVRVAIQKDEHGLPKQNLQLIQ